MTPLRQRLIDDLRIRNYAVPTIQAYVNGVARLAQFFNRSPDLLGPDDIRAFQLDLIQRRYSWSQINITGEPRSVRSRVLTDLGSPDFVSRKGIICCWLICPQMWPRVALRRISFGEQPSLITWRPVRKSSGRTENP